MRFVKTEFVVDVPDILLRLDLWKRETRTTNRMLAKRMGLTPQRFGQMWSQRTMEVSFLVDLERAMGVTREFWSKPLPRVERPDVRERLRLIGKVA